MAVREINYFLLVMNVVRIMEAAGDRSITTGPANTTVSIGDSVTLTCSVTGESDEPTYVAWKQNGRFITDDYEVSNQVDGQRYSVTSGAVNEEYNLRITSINTLDDGKYTCAILSRLNPLDTVASSSAAWLTYKSPPRDNFPECSSSTGKLTYHEGEEVTFTCRSDLGVPPVELSWVGQEQDATEYTQGTLRVSEFTKVLTRADNGRTFECDLSHELVTDDRSCTVGKLNVQYSPTDVTVASDDSDDSGVQIGETVSINCKADANPPIDVSTIRWETPPGIPQSQIRANEQVLVITDVKPSFNGQTVECVVKNERGEARGSYTLSVIIPSTKASTSHAKVTTVLTKSTSSSTPPFSSTKNLIDYRYSTTESADKSTTKPEALPDTKYSTEDPKLTLDQVLGVERNFLIALMVGACFLILCFVLLLLLVFGKKRAKTIVVVNSEDNLRKLSTSAVSVNGTKLLLGNTPVMARRNRNVSDNPSDDQSFDSAIHLISPVTPGDQPDYRGQMVRSRSDISAVSSQLSGTGYVRVPSTELLINSQQRVDQPRYVVLDLVNQNGVPFPSADSGQVDYTSATTGRVRGRQANNKGTGFETIPLRSVSREQGQKLYMLQGDQYIPVQHARDQRSPDAGNNPVRILIGGSDNSSDEDLMLQENRSLLDQQRRPV